MLKKKKVVKITGEYKEALALLAARPEFKVFEKLLQIEEHNIIVRAFKIPSTDPELKTKKAQLEGRVFELRLFKHTFEAVRKGEDGDKNETE